jgi:DNA invertase Pin-like site-specific DNA recombinase
LIPQRKLLSSEKEGAPGPSFAPRERSQDTHPWRGAPKKILDTKRIAALRGKGVGWKRIATELGVGVGTIYRIALEGSKTLEKVF